MALLADTVVCVLRRGAPWSRGVWEWGCRGTGAPGNEGSTCNSFFNIHKPMFVN